MKRFVYLFVALLQFIVPAIAQTSSTGCTNNLLTSSSGYYGGFEAGSNNFANGNASTEYSYGMPPNGTYEIVNYTTAAGGGGYLGLGPHSGNSFLMAHTRTTSNSKLWYKTISVSPGSTYQFCAWIANIKTNPASGFTVNLQVNGTTIASKLATYGWSQVCGTYIVPANVTSITLSIMDPNGNGAVSHFLALDDICFTKTITPTGVIGDFVWNDIDKDGIQDASEPGLANVTVTLTLPGGTTKTTTTNSVGYYEFTGLATGTFMVTFSTPTGYSPSPSNAGGDDTKDSDPINGSAVLTLTSAQPTNSTIDAGFSSNTPPPTSKIGDFVWNDLDKDGIQDASEPGLANVTVTLTLPGGVTKTTTTNANGFYEFTGLAAGSYIVSFSTPSGYSASPANAGGDDTKDSDPTNGSVNVTLVSAQTNYTVDAGFYVIATAKIGDFVWNDLNKNGVQDAGEPGLANVLVTLTLPGGATQTATTNSTGFYQFTGLPAGTYTLSFSTPSGYTPSAANQGGDDTKDSDPINGNTSVTLTTGQVNNTVDAGFYTTSTGKIGDFVWNDVDKDGLQEANEPGLAGVLVTLSLPGGGTQTATTNNSGFYQFTGLAAGTYTVTFATPNGYIATGANQGADDTKDSDPTNGVTTVTLTTGQINNSIDAGFYLITPPPPPGGCPNSLVSESFENGSFSGGGGSDLHNGLPRNGSYQIVQNVGQLGGGGYLNVRPRTGNYFLASHTSNDEGDRVWYQRINVTPGQTYTFCAGVTLLKNLGNGANFILGLYVNGKSIGTGRVTFDWTQICGTYTAKAGETSIELSIRDPKKGLFFVAIDDICVIPNTPPGTLKLGNQVWNDWDGDGKHDADEFGIPGATISLYTDNNNDNLPDGPAIRTTVSDEFGKYLFTGLQPGRYIASMPILPGFQKSPNNSTQATSPFPDNDIDEDNNLVRLEGPNGPGGIVYTNAITLSENSEPTNDGDDANGNLTFDLAECGNGAIGDFVWNDLNNNGIQDAGEPGINGVVVRLTFTDGKTAERTTHNFNGQDGYYDFINLGPGTYTVSFVTPNGFTPSPSNQGGDDTKDSDPVNGFVSVTLAANQSDFTIDAGFKTAVSQPAILRLGNQVWNDFDGDGKHDANEPGIAGAEISLYTDNNSDNLPDGPAIRTTMSDATGKYLFTDLPEGRYIISMPILPGYQQSPNTSTQATSPFPDNNVDDDNNLVRLVGPNAPGGVLYTNAITLTTNQEPTDDGDDANGNLTFDLAECGTGAIGDFVWNDLNGNGIQDAGEPGINDVLVRITFSDGRFAEELTHNFNGRDGYYDFINLGPGTYVISFPTPAGFTPSPANQGGDDTRDSDPVNGSVTVTLVANQSDFTNDAGFVSAAAPKLTLGNSIFVDVNGNGIKDAGETGIGGITVNLYVAGTSTIIKTTTTDASGNYLFTNLNAGDYFIGVVTPTGYGIGANGVANPNNDVDNDNNGTTVVGNEIRTGTITLLAGTEPTNDGDGNNGNLTLDVAIKTVGNNECPGNVYYQGFELGPNTTNGGSDLYNGLPRNGSYQIVQNVGQLGGGGYLNITPKTGSWFLASHTSNSESDRVWYSTVNVTPGQTYNFCFSATLLKNLGNGARYILGIYADGQQIGTGRVTFDWTQICGTFTVPAGKTSIEISIRDPKKGLFFVAIDDICITPVGSNGKIGDFVWKDLNGNGVQDANEPGLPGVEVTLTLPNGTTRTTTSDANGFYVFTGLPAGTFTVRFATPTGFTPSPANQGGDDTKDSDPVNEAVSVTLAANQVNLSVDAGFVESICIARSCMTQTFNSSAVAAGKYIWFNSTIKVTGLTGNPTTVFVNNGTITFRANNVDYSVPVPKSMITFSSAITTAKTTYNSLTQMWEIDVPYNTATDVFAAGVTFPVPTGGLPANLGPVTWCADFSATTPGLTIKWKWGAAAYNNFSNNYNTLGVLPVNGLYQVGTPQTYLAYIIPGGTGGGGTSCLPTTTVTVIPCVTQTVCLGNYVWNDYDGDGKKDLNEYGLGGVRVSLYRDDNHDNIPDDYTPIATTYTDFQGYYLFTGLSNGRYITSIPILPAFVPSPNTTTQDTSPFPDNDVDNDNNAVRALNGEVYTNAITLIAGTEPQENGYVNLTMDMALCGNLAIGNFVWNDINKNGIQDAGEDGINGVTVTILFPDGVTTATKQTFNWNPSNGAQPIPGSGAGYYDFINLGPGTYTLTFSTPSGYTPSPEKQGVDDTKDSDPDASGNVTVTLDIPSAATPNTSNLNVDAGYYQAVPAPAARQSSAPCNLQVSLEGTDPLCYKHVTGSIKTTVTGNVGTLKYSWTNGSTGANLSNVGAGKYRLTVKDNSTGCEVTSNSVTLVNPDKLTASASSVSKDGYNITCADGKSGNIELNVAGGKGTYTYEWSNGVTIKDLSGVAAGKFTVLIKDESKCTVSTSITLTQPASKLEATPIVRNITCSNPAGAIDLKVAGGKAPYAYAWSNNESGSSVENLSAGNYTATVKDALGCEVATTVELKKYDLDVKLVADRSTLNTAAGITSATLRAEATGGAKGYTYTWSDAASLNGSDKVATVKPTANTEYSVTVKDAEGCTATASLLVKVANETPVAKLKAEPAVVVSSIKVSPNPSTGNFKVSLDGFAAGKVDIKILDENGKEVANKQVLVSGTQQSVAFNLNRVSRGMYFVHVIATEGTYKEKLIIK
jgi:hypothetical protein